MYRRVRHQHTAAGNVNFEDGVLRLPDARGFRDGRAISSAVGRVLKGNDEADDDATANGLSKHNSGCDNSDATPDTLRN